MYLYYDYTRARLAGDFFLCYMMAITVIIKPKVYLSEDDT